MAPTEPPPPRKGWEPEAEDGNDTDPLKARNAQGKRTHCSVREAFALATKWELFILLVGQLGAIGHGFSQPGLCVLFGELIDAVAEDGDVIKEINKACLQMLILGCAAMVCAAAQMASFQYFSRKQAARFRVLYVQSVLHQDVTWFDNRQVESLPTQMSLDAEKISDAFGDKLGSTCMSWWAFLGGVLAAFIVSWHLALACLIMIPLCGVAAAWMGSSVQMIQGETQSWYAAAAAVVEECLYAFRTVVAFGGEKRELAKFGHAVDQARRGGVAGGFKIGLAFACNMSVMFLSYALAFYIGATLVYDGVEHPTRGRAYTSGDVIATTFCVFVGGFFMGGLPPGYVAFLEGRRAMCNLLDAQNTPTTIESSLEEDGRAQCPDIESMEVKEVRFSYPSRPEVQVLAGLNLYISKGQKVAIVGESGSGKSTVMSLLERFYDPDIGAVLINGKDMKTFAVKTVRRRIGYVGQEPVLFAASIKENILQGSGELQNLESELNLVVAEAELHFVNQLPQGLNTYVGSGGSQFSGGQKQRIAIARALIKKTSVLFFDEATSALDNKSERMIQHTIDRISSRAEGNLTMVSIAHRLTTIQHSDLIYVLAKGVQVERGTHSELLQKQGTYYALAAAQKVTEDKQTGETQEVNSTADAQQAGEASSIAQTSLLSKSQSLDAEAKEKERANKVAKEYKVPMRRVLSFCRPEWPWLLPAILGALVDGSSMPVSVVFLVQAMDSLGSGDKEDMLETMEMICLLLVGIAAVDFCAVVIAQLSLAIMGEAMTMRLRVALLTQLFRQEVGFHDDPENTPARLGQALELWAYRMSTLVKSWGAKSGVASSIIVGLVIAYSFSWEIATALLLSIPITIVANVLQMVVALGSSKTTLEGLQRAEQISADAVQNVRMCHACVNEDEIVTLFKSLLKKASEGIGRKVILSGMAFGLTVGTIFWVLAAGFYLAGVMVDKGDRDFIDVITAFLGVFFSAMGAGQCAATMGDATKAKVAAHDMFKLLDRESAIDSWDPQGKTLVLDNHMEAGVISFEAVRFRYPFRPDVEVLQGMSFSVQQGQSAGLVGPSGGGKSTLMAMIQRFYDPDAGHVHISLQRQALSSLNIVWWRRQLGFVGQEPILFNTTVKANIMYGLSEDESVSDDWLEKCTKMANLAFLDEQPKRLETEVGPKGSRLSGGQKQRVAICRALLRNPPVLLFDEATSALDTQSEQIVQRALETVREGRTSFSIAHRLSTISDCHVILVVSSGIIVEKGTHAELMSTSGVYSKLVQAAEQYVGDT